MSENTALRRLFAFFRRSRTSVERTDVSAIMAVDATPVVAVAATPAVATPVVEVPDDELSPAFLDAVRERAGGAGIVWCHTLQRLTSDERRRVLVMSPFAARQLLRDVDRRQALPSTGPMTVVEDDAP